MSYRTVFNQTTLEAIGSTAAAPIYAQLEVEKQSMVRRQTLETDLNGVPRPQTQRPDMSSYQNPGEGGP